MPKRGPVPSRRAASLASVGRRGNNRARNQRERRLKATSSRGYRGSNILQYILLVYNTNVAWDHDFAYWYASLYPEYRFIILGLPFTGTTNNMAYDPTHKTELWEPVREVFREVDCPVVLASAGVPWQTRVYNQQDDDYNGQAGTAMLLAGAQIIAERSVNGEPMAINYGAGQWLLTQDYPGLTRTFDTDKARLGLSSGEATVQHPLLVDPDNNFFPINDTAQLIRPSSKTGARHPFYGHLGDYRRPDVGLPIAADDTAHRDIILRSRAAQFARADRNNAEIIIGIHTNEEPVQAILYEELRQRGANVKYWHRNAPASATAQAYCPASGDDYLGNVASLTSGNIPYDLHVGPAAENNVIDADYAASYPGTYADVFTPKAGAGCMIDQSQDRYWAARSSDQGGGTSLASTIHHTTIYYSFPYAIVEQLWRGASWLGAHGWYYYTSIGTSNYETHVVYGDPLTRPFNAGGLPLESSWLM